MGNEDTPEVGVDEVVVLRKFEGDVAEDADEEVKAQAEIERVTVDNGLVVSHDRYENGEKVGPVEDSDILGKDIGRLVSD